MSRLLARMKEKLFFLVVEVMRTGAQAATRRLKNHESDFPRPELLDGLANVERCLATVGKLASGGNAQSVVGEATRLESSVAMTGYEEDQSLKVGDVVEFAQNQGLADNATHLHALRGGGTLVSGAFAVSPVERVSVEEWGSAED